MRLTPFFSLGAGDAEQTTHVTSESLNDSDVTSYVNYSSPFSEAVISDHIGYQALLAVSSYIYTFTTSD